MDFLKRNLFLIGCIAAAAGGIALVATGLGAMPKVVKEMESAKALYAELTALQGSAANQRVIDDEQKRIDAVLADYDKLIAKAQELYANYKPLVEGVFPNGKDDLRREFRRKYVAAMTELMTALKWGQPAQDADVRIMMDRIANERRKKEEESGGTFDPKNVTTHRNEAGVLTEDGARWSERARADIAAAQRIYCYATMFDVEKKPAGPGAQQKVASLEFDPEMRDTGSVDAPPIEFCWRAQLSYWIQKDVVDAIVAVNGAAAEAELEKGGTPWVGVLPIKEIISVRVGQKYVPADADAFAGAKPEGLAAGLPPESAASFFTGTASGPDYEVQQFTLKLVADPRELPMLIEKITANRFHTLLRVAYRAIPPNKDMTGKIYGSEPAVLAVLDFESVQIGSVFRPLMPIEVCESYAIECPKREEAAEAEGKE